MDDPVPEESMITLTLRQGVDLLVKKIQSGTKTQFECSLCQELTSSLGYIKVHYSIKHRDPNLKCEFCGLRSFPNDDTFQNHLTTFHHPNNAEDEVNPLQCQACGKVSKDQKALCRHIRESHRSDKYPCTVCSVEFTRPENLKVHMKSHQSDAEKQLRPLWECKECGKTFKLKTSMRQHVKLVHRQKSEVLECDICHKNYNGAIVLARHVKMAHEKEKIHKCNLCPAKFKTLGHLKRHLNSSVHAKPVKKRRRDDGQEDDEEGWDGGDKIRTDIEVDEVVALCDTVGTPPSSESSGTRKGPVRKCKSVASQNISKSIAENDEDEEVEATIKSRRSTRPTNKSRNKSKSTSSTSELATIKLEPGEKIPESDEFIVNDIIKIEEPFYYVPEPEADSSYDPCDFEIGIAAVKTEGVSFSPNHKSLNHLSDDSNDDSCTANKTRKEELDLEKNYFCMYCEQGFSSLEAVEMHEKPCGRLKRCRKSWGCTVCDKVFPSSHTLKMHMTRHSDERRFSCPLCPATFKGPTALKNHHSVIHQKKESAWSKWKKIDHSVPCDKCGKVLACPKNLRRHEQEMHSTSELDKKPHKCHLCSNRNKRSTELKNHVRLDHEQKVGFECTICSVWFNRQRKLDDHFKRKRHLNRVKKGKKKRQGRHPGACNILIRNLPETEESDAITKKVMQLLFPQAWANLRVIVAKARVGPAGGGRTRAMKTRIRPLRVILPSVYYRNVALNNVSKLKKEEAFKHLSVTKDFRSKDVGVKDGQLLRVRY